jgi:hypothetical protein
MEAMHAFQLSFGIDDDVRTHLYEKIGNSYPDAEAYEHAWLLCGILLGLAIADS